MIIQKNLEYCHCTDIIIINRQKFFVPLLRHLAYNQFTLMDSFEFAKLICEQGVGLFMTSLDVDSLSLLRKPSIFVLMSYSKVIVVFMVLKKNKLPRCFL